jgi:damage-control phosphatase, subfamily I
MRSEARCIPCVIQQCQRIVQMITDDEDKLLSVTHRVLDRIQELTLDEPPSLFTSRVLLETYAALGVEDPFGAAKKKMNELGSRAADIARAKIEHTSDPMHTAILYAAAGNIIDIGPRASFDLDAALASLHFKHDDYRIFRDRLHGAEHILYLLDNAGEIFFDKLLIERLAGYHVTMVVKPGPILNDATGSDADAAGLKQFGDVITAGARVLGVDFANSSPEFLNAFETADVVIAKGHANFESVVDAERDAFFILKVKCPVVATRLKASEGDSVFYYSPVRAEAD